MIRPVNRLVAVSLLMLAGLPAPQAAEHDADRITLDETVISGNQELPKVLYILPWQSPEGRPQLSLDAGLKDDNVLRRVYPPAPPRVVGYGNRQPALGREKDRPAGRVERRLDSLA